MQRNYYTKEISKKNHYGIIYFPEDIDYSLQYYRRNFPKLRRFVIWSFLFFDTFSKNTFMI